MERPNKRWTDAELAALCERYPDERAADIARDLGRPLATVYNKANALGLCKSTAFKTSPASGRLTSANREERCGYRAWTAEEDAIMRRRYPHERSSRLVDELGRTLVAIRGRAKILGLSKTAAFHRTNGGRFEKGSKIGLGSRFQPGHVPASKGTKGIYGTHPNCRKTQFKKGQPPRNELPIGSYTRTTKDRYWVVKLSMTGLQRHRWRPVHRLVWEQHRGPVPHGHIVALKGGRSHESIVDPREITIDILECITLRENMLRNTFRNYPEPIVKVIHAKGVLTREINKQRGSHGRKRQRRSETHASHD